VSPPENREIEVLIEAATTAWRPQGPSGQVRSHPAWADLDAAGRVAVYEATRALRRLEAARDSQGLSSTAKRVLALLRGEV
jgi:hypothetical protein